MLKIIGIVVVVLLLIPATGLAVLALKPPKSRPPSTEKVEATPERLARGQYLVEHVSACVDCHSERDPSLYAAPIIADKKGDGGECFDQKLGMPGVVCAQNITPDPTGLGGWSDGEIIRAIREGVSRDGHALFPMMPYGSYRNMSDEDVRSVVAYLRTLKPISRSRPPSQLDFPVNLMIKLAPQPVEQAIQAPPPSDRVAYGKYVTTIAGCKDCHSRQEQGKVVEGMEFAGGVEFPTPWGRVVSANLTPDPETGLGNRTREQFIGRFKAFASLDPKTPAPPGRNTIMPWRIYAGMTEEDLGAMYDYLHTFKPVKQAVNFFPDAK